MSNTKKVICAEDLRKRIVEDRQIRGKAFAAVMRHLEEAAPVKVCCHNCGRMVEGDCHGVFARCNDRLNGKDAKGKM